MIDQVIKQNEHVVIVTIEVSLRVHRDQVRQDRYLKLSMHSCSRSVQRHQVLQRLLVRVSSSADVFPNELGN